MVRVRLGERLWELGLNNFKEYIDGVETDPEKEVGTTLGLSLLYSYINKLILLIFHCFAVRWFCDQHTQFLEVRLLRY